MTHAHVRRRLSAYLEGELGLREEARLESHLFECAPCAAELRALRRAVELLRALPAPEPSRDLGAAVIARLRAGEGQPSRIRSPWFLRGAAPGGWLAPFALAMGVGAVLWLGQLGGTRDADGFGELALAAPAATRSSPREARGTRPGTPGGVGIGAPAASAPAEMASATPLPSIASCLGRSGASECAGWDHWWVELALADARRFAYELDGLPAPVRDQQLRRISEFAARSGSALMIGDELRRSRDPRAIRYARRFERGRSGVGVVQAGWSGR
jgi:hypothetical protein